MFSVPSSVRGGDGTEQLSVGAGSGFVCVPGAGSGLQEGVCALRAASAGKRVCLLSSGIVTTFTLL